ncbi:hypothetical protein DVH24_003255 [Malus domestica]|uniref:RNase H type-1 domain-containing protein n=1 Tax=Malus domestica TaxID=3750 RepID=A0A498IL13_MALDO|nr:hypothetical protein DVH24_003255 [Malus domestica]
MWFAVPWGLANKLPTLVKEPRQQRWIATSDGWFKLKVDGATKMVERIGGVGGVIRGSDGGFKAAEVMAAGVWRFQGLSLIKQVQLLALHAELQLMRSLRCTQVAVETDSLEAMTACNERNMDLTNLVLMAEFGGFTISYIPLAGHSFGLRNPRILFEMYFTKMYT